MSKATELFDQMRDGWVNATNIMKQNNWKSHTLRGVISAHAKKTGAKVERKRVNGVTSYRVVK